MTDGHLLAIDNGTQSVRALLFDARGTLVDKARVEIEPYVSPRPGWAEQRPELYWEKLCEACQLLWSKTSVPREAIVALGLTTQRATMVNVDAHGNALRPAIVWLDQRRTYGIPPIKGPWAIAFGLTGMTETLAYFQAEAESNWIRRYQPDIWDKTHKYLFLSGYLTHRLIDRFVDSTGCQVGYVPFDYRSMCWAGKGDWKWLAVPMPEEYLPDLLPPGALLGQVTRAASEATGIPEGLPMIAAAADKACEVIGAGALAPHVGCLSYGTTATINTTHRRYTEVIPLVPPYPSAVPERYSLEVQIYRGYWMVNWFRHEFGLPEENRAIELGVEPESLFDELAAAVPAGSMGLVLQPYWSPGVKVPGPEAKGALIGFGDIHTRAHMYRAIIEGLAYALREGMERIERRSRTKVTELRVSGGGSQSDQAMQITADIFGLPTARPHIYETSGLGAAIDAAVGIGIHPSFETAVAEMTRLGDVFDPNPESAKVYDALYRRVYLKMYERLKPLYEEIRAITRYPQQP
ncbi:MAG: carbohydrate kinase [Chloroflexi bacterium]|nr:carbohydrate kinase [Chloroflexota bacterium]